ncbi:MAG: protein BatD, partial [Rhizobacter sp.]|nr:protein BatD [Chlorobiales bacterium]
NGKMSVSKAFAYPMVAEKEGKHTIPAATVAIDGKTYKSNTIEMTVAKAGQPPPTQAGSGATGGGKSGGAQVARDQVFIRPVVSKTNLVVGEPATVTYKLYCRVLPQRYETTQEIKSEGFWIEKFDLGKQAPMTNEYLNGEIYRVAILNKLQVFPTKSGQLEISPYLAQCEVSLSDFNRVRGKLFDNFNDFFGAMGKVVPIQVYAPAIKFTVAPLPEPKPESFAGAVGNYTFKATLDKDSVRTGDPLTFKFTVTGEGNINALSDVSIALPPTFEKYDPKTDKEVSKTNGVVSGTKTDEIVVIPRASGKFDVAPVEFSYYDPHQKKYITEKSEAFTITVSQGAEVAGGAFTDKRDIARFGNDIRFIKTNAETLTQSGSPLSQSVWFYSAFLAPVLAFVFFAVQKRRDEKMQSDVAFARSYIASPEAKKRLKAAKEFLKHGQQKEFFAETESAIIKFIGNKFNTDDQSLTKDEVRAYLTAKKLDAATVDLCIKILNQSEYYRFAPSVQTADDLNMVYDDAEKVISEISKL